MPGRAVRLHARRGFRATDFMLDSQRPLGGNGSRDPDGDTGTWVETNAGGHARRDAEELALNDDAV